MIEYSNSQQLVAAFYNGAKEGSVKCSGAKNADSIRSVIYITLKRAGKIPEGYTIRMTQVSYNLAEYRLAIKLKTKGVYKVK